jgi:hypothetical protein
MSMDDTLQTYRDELKSFAVPEETRESNSQAPPAFLNDNKPHVPEWEHAIMRMDATMQSSGDGSESFDMSERSGPVFLDSHQDALVSNDAFAITDMNNLFQLDWLEHDLNNFVWQPEMPTWAT